MYQSRDGTTYETSLTVSRTEDAGVKARLSRKLACG